MNGIIIDLELLIDPQSVHSQCLKEMDDHLLVCQQFFEIEPLSDTPC
jgi:hypothetical protein